MHCSFNPLHNHLCSHATTQCPITSMPASHSCGNVSHLDHNVTAAEDSARCGGSCCSYSTHSLMF